MSHLTHMINVQLNARGCNSLNILGIYLLLNFFLECCTFLRIILRIRIFHIFNVSKSPDLNTCYTSHINHLGQSDIYLLEEIYILMIKFGCYNS